MVARGESIVPQDVLVSFVPWHKWVEEHLCSSSSVTAWAKTFFDNTIHVLELSHVVTEA